VLQKDSLEITDADRAALAAACAAAKQSKIVITHGTSTMVQTARELVVACPGKSIVITGE
jgi:hypothetical protein